MNEIEKAAPHFVDLVDSLHRGNVLVPAFRALRIPRQGQPGHERNVISDPTTRAAIRFKVPQLINKAALGTA